MIAKKIVGTLQRPEVTLIVILIAIGLVVGMVNDNFWSVRNLTDIGRSASFMFIVAVGTTFVLISGGLDLSVGSIYGLGGIVCGLAIAAGWPVPLAIVVALASGLAIGIVNGLLVTLAQVPSVIATLGGLFIVRGMARVFSGGAPVYGLPEAFTVLGRGMLLGIPIPIWIAAAVGILGQLILSFTVIGRRVFHVGGNEAAALIAGVPVVATRIFVFAISGLTAAMGGILVAARVTSAQPNSGSGLELSVIAAVIIGGTSMFGGSGSILGTLFGALLLAVLDNGMILMQIDPFYQSIVVGIIIIAAVGLDGWRRRQLGAV
jgi:ribose/xylose/arabinose/galactoside ABC-type transport system permease subunit